ncbi:MAG: hypothetical protein WA656_15075, partial [Pseudolabrys sp.]
PEAGRASGLKKAWVSNTAPRRPTLAWAKADSPGLLAELGVGRLFGSGVVMVVGAAGAAACLVT